MKKKQSALNKKIQSMEEDKKIADQYIASFSRTLLISNRTGVLALIFVELDTISIGELKQRLNLLL